MVRNQPRDLADHEPVDPEVRREVTEPDRLTALVERRGCDLEPTVLLGQRKLEVVLLAVDLQGYLCAFGIDRTRSDPEVPDAGVLRVEVDDGVSLTAALRRDGGRLFRGGEDRRRKCALVD